MSRPASAMAAMAATDPAQVAQFLFHEARLLDEKRLAEWRDLFVEEGTYWAPTRHDQASPDECVSLFFDDRAQMAARIRRLESPDAHVQQPVSHTVHMLSNIEIEDVAPGMVETVVHSVFCMAEYRHTEQRQYAGRYTHRLRCVGNRLFIVQKKVVLVNCHAAHTAMAIYL